MRSEVDLTTARHMEFRSSRARFWRRAFSGLCICALMVLALALLEAPAYGYAIVLLGWGSAGFLWLRDDVEALAGRSAAAVQPSSDPSDPPRSTASAASPAWQHWVAGWYWETDRDGLLLNLRPGADLPPGLNVDWPELSAFLQARPRWISCWSEELGEPGTSSETSIEMALREGVRRLEFALVQQAAWSDALSLPWPSGLSAIQPASGGWTCRLRAQERHDAHGRVVGLHGVLVPQPPAAQASAPSPIAHHEDPEAVRLREAEQEALRYAISHDLRAPLRVVEGFTRIVKEDYGRHLDRLGQDHLERVLAASARMNGMIDAILAQAQLSGEPLQRVPVDLSALARDIGADILGTLPDAARARFDVADGLQIDADPQLVRRVLENLIGNAFKYSAKVAEPRVEVGVMPATNPAVFFVRDNGAGFDMQHADKLFGMFQRLHSAKEFPGTGVGLAGVQNIIRRHGGRVWAEARPGQGACFYFTLMDTLQAQQRSAR